MEKRRLRRLNKRISLRKILKRPAQVTIEITFAFIVIFLLFYTSTRIFVWFCDSLTNRQLAYEDSRALYNRDGRDGPQVQPSDVADLDSYLHNPSAPYYNAPLTLVE